jgi:nitroimidazol reductase NimA-like FMN-containing flavoprotein (pyridoxamine 5'-phosphate oxidase superfamily)
MIVRGLDKQQMMSVLASNKLGRLACVKDGQPYVVPITFSFSESCLYSFSMPGQKID